MRLHWNISLLCLCFCIGMTKCCLGGGGGSSQKPKPTTTTTVAPSHRLPCTAQEVHRANCLNGGTCFAVVLRGIRTLICSCPPQRCGKQCERRCVDPGAFAVQEGSVGAIAGIIVGCIAAVVVLFLVGVFVYYRCFRLRAHQKDSSIKSDSNRRHKRVHDPPLATISENGMTTHLPYDTHNGYHNMTLSSENNNPRLSALSSTSNYSDHQFETAM